MKSKNLEKMGDVLEQMGFNKNSSQSAKASFLKHLIKQAYNVNVEIPEIYKSTTEVGERSIDSLFENKLMNKNEEQLEFLLDDDKAS